MTVEKMNPENYWIDNFCLKFFNLDFILFLYSKQSPYIWNYLWNLYLLVFLLFLET